MTYVINLGVPPLLFTQVLYGRALYTSSILIGIWWLSVIVLLMAAYSLLYIMIRWDEAGRTAGWVGIGALLVVLSIGMIYSTNMSLMLRPDQWLAMYRSNPMGRAFHTGDPTVMPRWLFVMVGSVGVSGIALLLVSFEKRVGDEIRRLFVRWGGRLVATFTAVQVVLGVWAFRAQPELVRSDFSAELLYRACSVGWLVAAALLIGLGAAVSLRKSLSFGLVAALLLVSFCSESLFVLARHGIRLVALLRNGYDVWASDVNTNWSTVIVFLICFVVALGMVAWLASVVARATPREEPITSADKSVQEKSST